MILPGRSWGPDENLTLSDAELERCEPVSGEGGKALRARCPFHGGDRQRSLRVNLETGHFKCHNCGTWGYLESARKRRRDDVQAPYGARLGTPTRPPGQRAQPPKASSPLPPRPELAELMIGYRDALPGSAGERYLLERRIPLEVAQAVGVGYAAPKAWAHRDAAGRPVRDWHRGRLVFPHTDPVGNVVNLYGRAVGDAPKEARHDHLSGGKGYFNAQALRHGSGPVTVCEGAFDALALMAAGAPRVVAIFGVNGWRWDWARDARELILALDGDATGTKHFHDLARQAALRGKHVAYLEPGAYGAEKDASAAWNADTLYLGDWATLFPVDGLVTSSETASNEDAYTPARGGRPAHAPEPTAATSPGSDQLGDLLTPDDRSALDDLATDYRDDDPDVGTVLPTDPAGHALERLVRADGADRLPLTDAMLAEARHTAREIVSDPDDPFYTASDFAAELVASWNALEPTDHATGWAAWQFAVRWAPWLAAEAATGAGRRQDVGSAWIGRVRDVRSVGKSMCLIARYWRVLDV